MTNRLQTKTNILETLKNSPQATGNIWPTTRKRQMIWLSVLTSVTLIGQYIMLGETGLSKKILDSWFEGIELSLWGLRALVEVFVVIYIAMTKTNNDKQEATLNRFKVGLIFLIILTVGPVWLSRQYETSDLDDILTTYGTYSWSFAIAGISAIMLWGVATAYKYQSTDDGYFSVLLEDYHQMLAIVSKAEIEYSDMLVDVDEMQRQRDQAVSELNGMKEAISIFKYLPPSAQVKIIALFAGGITPSTLAQEFGLSESTVRGVFAQINNDH